MPTADDEGEHIADEIEVEEIEHVAEIGGGYDLPLISGEPLLLLQKLEHRRPPCGAVHAFPFYCEVSFHDVLPVITRPVERWRARLCDYRTGKTAVGMKKNARRWHPCCPLLREEFGMSRFKGSS